MKKAISVRFSPQVIFVGLAVGMMAYLTLISLLMLIYGSLQSGQPGTSADFTRRNYLVLLDKWRLIPAVLNKDY
jgi:hypothetical protein